MFQTSTIQKSSRCAFRNVVCVSKRLGVSLSSPSIAWVALCLVGTICLQDSLAAQDRTCPPPIDWTTLASTYTHDRDGRRVDQFATRVEPYAIERVDFQQSGFRHTRSTLQAGASTDHYHSVERWGAPVQPYGEWRYPYRPFAVPYGAWGPQPPAVNVQGSGWNGHPGFPIFPGYGGNGFPGSAGPNVPGHAGPNWNNGFGVGPANALRPEQDDYYPPALEPPPISDRDFFYSPYQP
jgi:hypothetical protein